MKRTFLAPAIGALMLAVATPAFAQWRDTQNRRPTYGYGSDTRQIGYDNGFREGIDEGEKDGRRGERYRYQDERDFQRADRGYRNSYGNRDVYRQAFRTGFADGYADGFRRYSRDSRGRYGDRRDDDRYGSNRSAGGGTGILGRIFGSRDPRSARTAGGYYAVAYENGLRDGLEKGREDIRKNRSFDPRRHEWYRDGDRSYNSRYGSRDEYKIEYRRGFTAGYDGGFREARYRY